MLPAGATPRAVLLVPLLVWPCLAQQAKESADDKVAWLAKNAVTISSVDPRTVDFTDLQPLKQAIGKARVVYLGGSRDPAVVKAKYRLVRFLHEEMGFDALVAPAPLWDAEQTENAMEQGKHLSAALSETMGTAFGSQAPKSWFISPTNLLHYALETHKSGQPLRITGYGRPLPSSPVEQWAKSLFQFIDSIDPAILPREDRKAIKAILPLIHGQGMSLSFRWQLTPPARGAIARLDNRLAHLMLDHPKAREIAFYRLTLADVASWTGMSLGMRDALPWYAAVWRPNSRLIVWSSNLGVASSSLLNGAARDDRSRTSGDFVGDFYASGYTIAFDEIRTADSVLQLLVAAPEPHLGAVENNLESLLHTTNIPYAFFDLRPLPADHWLRRPLTSSLLGHPAVRRWTGFFDAIVSIDLPSLKQQNDTRAK